MMRRNRCESIIGSDSTIGNRSSSALSTTATLARKRSGGGNSVLLIRCPIRAERAVEIAEGGGVAFTEKITVRNIAGEKYDRVIGYKLGPLPEPVPAGEFGDYDESETPF